jgi:hypothetical protein
MSIVTIQLGQCGNQVGGQLFNTLSQEAVSSATATATATTGSTSGIEALIFERYYYLIRLSYLFELLPIDIDSFFRSSSEGKDSTAAPPYARAVMVDMEPKALMQTATAAKVGLTPPHI